jgi:hypothetical protein
VPFWPAGAAVKAINSATVTQGDLIAIQTATKESIQRKATNQNYVDKGPISARAAIQAVWVDSIGGLSENLP